MVFRGTGRFFEVVGINCSGNGRSCKDHSICGELLYDGALISIRSVSVRICNTTEEALAVHLFEEGTETCRVGFLKNFLVKHKKFYDGKLARIVEIFDPDDSTSSIKRKMSLKNVGCARAEIVERMKHDNDDDDDDGKKGIKRERTDNDDTETKKPKI